MSDNNQRGFFGIVIPKGILEDQELNITEKFIYGYIASFTRCCYESNETIANKLGISESTVKHAIPKLTEKGYFFVEKVNNSNNNRRIYSVLDNPKKLAYLSRKGMFKPVENSETVVQNLPDVVQNMHYEETGVRSAKYAHKEKEEKENKAEAEQKPNITLVGLAGDLPSNQLAPRPKKSDYKTMEEYEAAIYNFMAS